MSLPAPLAAVARRHRTTIHLFTVVALSFRTATAFAQPYDTLYARQFIANVHREGNGLVQWHGDSILMAAGYHIGSGIYTPQTILLNSATGDSLNATTTVGEGVMARAADDAFFNINRTEYGVHFDSVRVHKFTGLGELEWTTKLHSGACFNMDQAVAATADSGCAVLMIYSITNCSNPVYETSLTKLSKTGVVQWVKTDSGFYQIEGIQLVALADGYAMLWYEPLTMYRLARTDLQGDTLWTRYMTRDVYVSGRGDLAELENGTLAVVNVQDLYEDTIQLFKFSASGTLLDSVMLPGDQVGDPQRLNAMDYSEEHGIIALASSTLSVLDTNGTVLWAGPHFNDPLPILKDVIITTEGNIMATGYRLSGTIMPILARAFYMYAVRTDINTWVVTTPVEQDPGITFDATSDRLVFDTRIHGPDVDLLVMDAIGRTLWNGPAYGASGPYWSTAALSPGIHLATLVANGAQRTLKFAKP